MKQRAWLIAGAAVLLAVGAGMGTGAAAEEPGMGNMAAESMAPATPTPTPAPYLAPMKKCSCETPGSKSELEISWNLALPMATYSENDETQSLSGMGFLLEINPGVKIQTAPGLDFGMAVGFLYVESTGEFSTDYEGPPTYTYNWTIDAISAGSYLLAQYSYDLDLEMVKIGLEHGVGLGYFINSVSADWVDASDSDIAGDNSSDENGWSPIMKLGLKVALPVTEVSCLGLNLAGALVPLQTGDYLNFLTLAVGLNYQVEF